MQRKGTRNPKPIGHGVTVTPSVTLTVILKMPMPYADPKVAINPNPRHNPDLSLDPNPIAAYCNLTIPVVRSQSTS